MAALVVSNSNKTFKSTTLLQMCTTATQKQAAEMMLPADNGCCITTFPHCTRRPRVSMAKSKTRLKILIKSNSFLFQQLCQQSLKFFAAIFLSVFLFSYCRGSIRHYFPQKIAFSMTLRLNQLS